MNHIPPMPGFKQGQGLSDPKTLVEFDQSNVFARTKVPVAFFTGDDGGIMWLKNQSKSEPASSSRIQSIPSGDKVKVVR